MPQTSTKIVDAPVAVTQQSVPVEAETSSLDRPMERVEAASVAVHQQGCCESNSKKRKSTLESDTIVDEASDRDASRTSTSTCAVSCETCGLVQRKECTRVVDETEVQGPEDELVHVAPNMEAGGSHPPRHVEPGMGRRTARDPPNGRVPSAPRKECST